MKDSLNNSARLIRRVGSINILGVMGIILFFCLFFLDAGCTKKPLFLEFSGDNFIMDTIIHITVYASDEEPGQSALKEAFAEFTRVNNLTDKFASKNLPNPEICDVYRINQNAGINPVRVSDDTLEMLLRSKDYFNLSDGAFDPSIGPVVDLWGFGEKEHRVPGDQEIEAKIALVGLDRVIVNADKKTVFLPQKGMVLDFGGIAKGYATDMAVKKLRELGIKHAMINAGGNVYALGTKPDGTHWRVGIQDPREENKIMAVLSVADTAVVTSGDYERYFIKGNVRYHHIIDPDTGKPARDLMETTIVAKSSAEADILSTAIFVLGEERGRELLKQLPEVEMVFVDAKRNVSFSQELGESLEFVKDSGYHLNLSF